MTLSTQPQDNDPIVEPFTDDFGNKVFIATQQFSDFLNDLVDLFNPVESTATNSQQLYESQQQIISGISTRLNIQDKAAKKAQSLIVELAAANALAQIKIASMGEVLNSSKNQINELHLQISAMSAKQKRLSDRLKKVENLCQ